MAGNAISIETAGGITRLTLNRPDKLNAFNAAMADELAAALGAAADDAACRVVVLTGRGRAFSAGQDLADVYVKGGPQPDLGPVIDRFTPSIVAIRTMAKPVIAEVNGMAAGAGASIALACDLVFAARSASFLQAFARIGLVPDCGGTWLLPRLVGDARARGLALLAEPIAATTAESWGLIWKAVDDDKLAAEVQAVADRLAHAPTYGLGLQKRAFLASGGNALADQLALERELQTIAGRSPDYAEGVGAFLEKRAPRFTGSGS